MEQENEMRGDKVESALLHCFGLVGPDTQDHVLYERRERRIDFDSAEVTS
jgi:hypothetical protein